MRVLIWASTLQADILALALHLERRPGCELIVAADGLRAFRGEPIAVARPLGSTVIDRNCASAAAVVAAFAPDVVVCDNHFPEFPAARRVASLWHGLGWKATPEHDVKVRLAHVQRLTGIDPRRPNARFLAQCYHENDRDWRILRWGVAPENCALIGSCFRDLLRHPPYKREQVARSYRIDVVSRPTLLVNLTWHYGRILPGGGWPDRRGAALHEDLALFRAILGLAADRGANALVCLHDRWRYDSSLLEELKTAAASFPNVELKHKDERPDNLADLLVADAMVSNLSSFVTFFYNLGRPTVHLCPPPGNDVQMMRMVRGRPRAQNPGAEPPWMLPPEDNGGLTAHDRDEALTAIDRALAEPDCCRERERDWLDRHLYMPAEGSSERMAAALERLVAGDP